MARSLTIQPKNRTSPAHVLICDSLGDAHAYIQAARKAGTFRSSGFTLTLEGERRLLTGDSSLVARADALMESLEALSPLADVRPELARVVAGSIADVPAYLSGSPVAMRQRKRREEKAPSSYSC